MRSASASRVTSGMVPLTGAAAAPASVTCGCWRNARSAATNQRPSGPRNRLGALHTTSTIPPTVTASVANNSSKEGAPRARSATVAPPASSPAAAASASAGVCASQKLRHGSRVNRRPRSAIRKKFTARAPTTPAATPSMPHALPTNAPVSTHSAYTSCRQAR